MIVAPSSGVAVWPTTSRAASIPDMPPCIRIRMPSVTTMALSTSIPRAMISAPSEMRSRMTSCVCMMMNEPMIVRASTNPMIKPERSPMNMRSTTITMATAVIRFFMNALMEMVTASDCRDTTPNSMPSGISPSSSRTLLSRACPMVTTLPPATVEMPSPIPRTPS